MADRPESSRVIPPRVPGLPGCMAGENAEPAEPGKPCRCYGAKVAWLGKEQLFRCTRCNNSWPKFKPVTAPPVPAPRRPDPSAKLQRSMFSGEGQC